MSPFRAFRLSNDAGEVRGAIVEMTVDDLTPGDVVIRSAWSGVNYKDALAATGRGKILKRFPLNGGIDVSGVVEASGDPRFRPGDEVLVTGYDLGVAQDGGYSAFVRVPGDWVVPLPAGLSLFEAMVLGTAGFTAALAVVLLERHGLEPGQGPVAVTGATGGVGSVAIACLARRGYAVTAITGKDSEHEYLRRLGASEVLSRATLQMGTRPLEKATWAAAVDALGGDMLGWLIRTTNYWGGVASCGLAQGVDLHATVLPFILRGVGLLGVDSVMCPMPMRRDVWRRLGSDLKPADLPSIAREIALDDLSAACSTLMSGQARGRFVVRLS